MDRSLGRYELPAALRAAGFVVHSMAEVYTEEVGQRLADTAWIPDVTRRGWVILSKDRALRSGEELEAIIASSARVFLIPDAGRSGREQIDRYLDNRYRLALRARKPGPALYMLGPDRIERLGP